MNVFFIFITFWVLIGCFTFYYLFSTSAPYGRHIREGWGYKIPALTGWVLMESPCVILMIIYAFLVREELNTIHFVFLFIWLSHYVHRTFVYPFVINLTNPHMPVSIAISAFCFNLVNVSIQAFGIFYFTEYSENWLSTNTFIFGLMVFAIGMYINIRSDYSIMMLKKKKGPGYHIPKNFLYKYISAPNYFGEIIEWIGWAILTWSISGVVFVLWVIANLFPRAIANHNWYKEKFDDYPKNRKAIIPGII